MNPWLGLLLNVCDRARKKIWTSSQGPCWRSPKASLLPLWTDNWNSHVKYLLIEANYSCKFMLCNNFPLCKTSTSQSGIFWLSHTLAGVESVLLNTLFWSSNLGTIVYMTKFWWKKRWYSIKHMRNGQSPYIVAWMRVLSRFPAPGTLLTGRWRYSLCVCCDMQGAVTFVRFRQKTSLISG